MKSNTVIFTEPYKAEIQEIDCPKPGKSEVLIRTEQTLISTGTELTFLTGECPEKSKWSEYIHYPQKSGYSNVGIIEEVGEGVSKDLIGKRVASFSGHSQYVIVNVNELRMINYEIKPEEATFFCTCRNNDQWNSKNWYRIRKQGCSIWSWYCRSTGGQVFTCRRMYRNFCGKQE